MIIKIWQLIIKDIYFHIILSDLSTFTCSTKSHNHLIYIYIGNFHRKEKVFKKLYLILLFTSIGPMSLSYESVKRRLDRHFQSRNNTGEYVLTYGYRVCSACFNLFTCNNSRLWILNRGQLNVMFHYLRNEFNIY